MSKLVHFYSCIALVLLNNLVAVSCAIPSEIQPSCPPSEPVCRLNFALSQSETMILYENGRGTPIVYRDGVFQKRLGCYEFEDATPEELDRVNMGDGQYKFVYGVNDQVPAPTVVLYDNQTLEVTLTNLQLHEGAGIHWHGLFQIGTPYMDGVPGVTQCAIHPMETFVYRFKAEPHGTHFYHSHMGVQRTDGVYGGLIVLPENRDTTLPEFDKEFLVLFHDWFPHTNIQDLYAYQFGLRNYREFGYNATTCEGTEPSTLINGRGYYYEDGEPVVPVPLTTYTVQEGLVYRFRIINSALETAYKLHIDQHKLTVIASDGSRVTPVEADYIIVHTGERYDVYIEANQPVDNYWVRVEFMGHQLTPGLAILRYEGAPEVLPTSSHTECSEEDPCELINCPFEYFADSSLNFECINIGDLTSTGILNYFPIPHHTSKSNESKLQELEEHFMVFEFTEDIQGSSKAGINAIHYIPPSSPPQIHREVDFDNDCSDFDCPNEPCRCTHMATSTIGNTVQMVFLGTDGPSNGHPIHLHGHRYQVMKVAYGTGSGIHADITCNTEPVGRCTTPSWTDPSWTGGNVPGMNEVNPPEKDTVIIPRGGYVVVRYYAANPGWWLLHCHMDFHFATGMGMIIQEGDYDQMPLVPNGMATCGSFQFDTGFSVAKETQITEDVALMKEETKNSNENTHHLYNTRVAVGFLLSFVCGFVLALCIVWVTMACNKKTEAVVAKQQQEYAKF